MKNIAEPVQAFRVVIEGQARRQPVMPLRPRWVWAGAVVLALLLVLAGTSWQFWPTATVSGKPSVAVLPFDSYGGDEATGTPCRRSHRRHHHRSGAVSRIPGNRQELD